MEILEMIYEWKKGCSYAGPFYDHMMKSPPGTTNPEDCTECTIELIRSIEQHERLKTFSGCITPKFGNVIDRLTVATANPHNSKEALNVSKADIDSLLHEFFRIDGLYRREMTTRKASHITFNGEEDHRVT